MPRREVAIIMNVNRPYDRKVVEGIARYVRTQGNWRVYVEDEPMARIPDLRHWKGHGVIADLDEQQVVDAVKKISVPVVNIGGAIFDESWTLDTPYVTTDNTVVARMAAEHLMDRGFRNFAYCGIRRTPFNPWARNRGEYFRQVLQEHGFSCSMYSGRHLNARQWDAVQDSLCGWLLKLAKPLGLFACNDARARHVQESCRRLKLRIPDDVAILGVDNDEMMCELANPALSSIELGTDRIGFEAACLLDQLMSGRRVARDRRQVQTEPVGVVLRASTDAMAVTDQLVSLAVAFIRDQIRSGVQVADVADHVDVSRSTLDNRFKALLGRTVHDEIERARIDLTKHLLLNSRQTLAQIAPQAGFSTVQYMSTVFRRTTGKTPGQFRESHHRQPQ